MASMSDSSGERQSSMSDSSGEIQSPMSNTERAKLAKQLDDDLDDFLDCISMQKDSVEPRKPFVYEEWCKEIEQHPAFMTDLHPDENGEFSEAVQALQALKYDEDESENRQLAAERYKNDGNKHFKNNKYHWAVIRYTDGINQRCTDRYLNSILYSNRAAAQKRLGNIGSAFRDCFFARKFDPQNTKAFIRGAECLVELGRGRQCLEWLQSMKRNNEGSIFTPYGWEVNDGCVDELYQAARQLAVVEERNERRRRQNAAKDMRAKQLLLSALKERKINVRPPICFDDPELFEWSQIEVQLEFLEESKRVYVDDYGVLHWPILAQYPETGKVDLITDCSEESSIDDIFCGVFQQKTSSDGSDTIFNCLDNIFFFRRDNVRYFVSLDLDEEYNSAELMPRWKIREAFSLPGFVVVQGLPTVQIYTKQHVEANFVKVADRFYKTK